MKETAKDGDLIARLAAHRRVGSAPREQLEWLAAHGRLLRFEPGDEISRPDEPMQHLFILLSGHASIRVDRGSGPRKVLEWRGGDVAGFLPYSRMVTPPGRATVEEPSEILAVHRDHFPEMIRDCYEVTAACVHVMLDRARRFTTSDVHDEKMVSLGRLSAGLAHELNNPASALARAAKELSAHLFEMEASALALGSARLTAGQLEAIAVVRTQCGAPGARAALSPLERADREDAVAEWLARRGVSADVAAALAETAVTTDGLERLAGALPAEALPFALRSIGAGCRTRMLASEVETASMRIHSLVGALKGFTYMDQSRVPQPVAIAQGLRDTLTILGPKARRKGVTVNLRVHENLPPVDGLGGELNQVWANLIDNAIDAASGTVEIAAECRGDRVVVRVMDDGPGVPEERKERIFEPFFTTKPQGEGTGLGLDIARRLVREHDGHIELDSRPGHTEFRVVLPRS